MGTLLAEEPSFSDLVAAVRLDLGGNRAGVPSRYSRPGHVWTVKFDPRTGGTRCNCPAIPAIGVCWHRIAALVAKGRSLLRFRGRFVWKDENCRRVLSQALAHPRLLHLAYFHTGITLQTGALMNGYNTRWVPVVWAVQAAELVQEADFAAVRYALMAVGIAARGGDVEAELREYARTGLWNDEPPEQAGKAA